jgi:hypothetical protein
MRKVWMNDKEFIPVVGPTAEILRIYFLSLAVENTDTVIAGNRSQFYLETTACVYKGYVLYREWDSDRLRGLDPRRVIIVNNWMISQEFLAPVWHMELVYGTEVKFVTV